MALHLKIENVSTLPDGGPLTVTVTGKRGIDIGRDQHLDWTLPDPTRFISGKHCEVRYHDDGYWLHDVSTNGTFLNGSEEPMLAPHRLRTGDRIEIGAYVVGVLVDEEGLGAAAERRSRAAPVSPADLWQVEDDDIAPPLPPERRGRPASAPLAGDFLDQRMDAFGAADDAFWGRDTPLPGRAPRGPARTSSIWGDDEEVPTAAAVVVAPPPERSPPSPPPEPPPERSPPAESDGSAAFVRALARGAEVPEALLARYPAEDLAELMGKLVRLSADNLKQLLSARSELKDIVKTSRTLVTSSDNNPLKLAPTVGEAMALMFAPASTSYLDAQATFQQSFRDLKHHQVQTFSAMQTAVTLLAKDLEPKMIEAQVEPDRGFGAVVSSRKARLWEAYVARWQAKVERHEDGLLGVFLDHFSDCYDRSAGKRP